MIKDEGHSWLQTVNGQETLLRRHLHLACQPMRQSNIRAMRDADTKAYELRHEEQYEIEVILQAPDLITEGTRLILVKERSEMESIDGMKLEPDMTAEIGSIGMKGTWT